MTTARHLKSVLIFGATFFSANSLQAQPPSRTETADEAFSLAVDLATAGDFATACPLLDRVQELDPTEGSHFALADCREREGRIETALHHWRSFVKTYSATEEPTNEKRKLRLKAATERIANLEAEVPRLSVVGAESERDTIRIVLDGKQIELNAIVELNPGEHRLVITRKQQGREFRVIKLERAQPLELVRIEPYPKIAAGQAPEQVQVAPYPKIIAGQTLPKRSQKNVTSKSAANSARNRAFGIGGLGVGSASIIAGGFLAGIALAERNIATTQCLTNLGGTVCTPIGQLAVNDGRAIGNIATLPLIFGAALTTMGVILVVRNPQAVTFAGFGWAGDGTPVVAMKGHF